MAQLAIKGHKTRGKEVIEILEMLGGVNTYKYGGDNEEICFAIGEFTKIIYYNWINNWINNCYEGGFVFTLEEFLERYPYKVGDKAQLDGWPCVITEMSWGYDDVIYSVKGVDFSKRVCSKDLQPYKEETMEDKGTLVQIDLTRELCVADEVEVILGDYEFVLRDGKNYFVKKKPRYPKTYEECCKITQSDPKFYIDTHLYSNKLESLYKLLICRNAYWKIAGEQMGLGKPWEPDWDNEDKRKYVITCQSNNIIKDTYFIKNTILAFPTAEMRDAFYENFKDLIEEAKNFYNV